MKQDVPPETCEETTHREPSQIFSNVQRVVLNLLTTLCLTRIHTPEPGVAEAVPFPSLLPGVPSFPLLSEVGGSCTGGVLRAVPLEGMPAPEGKHQTKYPRCRTGEWSRAGSLHGQGPHNDSQQILAEWYPGCHHTRGLSWHGGCLRLDVNELNL